MLVYYRSVIIYQVLYLVTTKNEILFKVSYNVRLLGQLGLVNEKVRLSDTLIRLIFITK